MKGWLISRIPQFALPGALASATAFYLSIACFAVSAACIGPTVPALAKQTGAALGEMGLIFFGGSVGYLIGSVFISRLFDRLPGHQLLGISLLVISTCMAAVPLVPSLWLLALVICLIGMSQGVINVGTNVMLLWIFGDEATPIINGMHFFFGVGAFLAPAFVAQAIIWGGAVRWAYWALAVLILIIALWVIMLRRSPKQKAQPIVEKAAAAGRVDYRLVLLLGTMLFFYVGSELIYGNWISTYAIQIGLANEAEAAYLTSAFWVALTAGRLVSIPVSFRLKAKTILWIAIIGSLASAGLTLAAPSSPVVLWIGTVGAGFFLAPIFPTVVSVANSVLRLNARLTGIIFFGDSLGAMVLPTAMGQIISGAGAPAMMFTLVVSLGLLLGVYAFFIRLTAGKER